MIKEALVGLLLLGIGEIETTSSKSHTYSTPSIYYVHELQELTPVQRTIPRASADFQQYYFRKLINGLTEEVITPTKKWLRIHNCDWNPVTLWPEPSSSSNSCPHLNMKEYEFFREETIDDFLDNILLEASLYFIEDVEEDIQEGRRHKLLSRRHIQFNGDGSLKIHIPAWMEN